MKYIRITKTEDCGTLKTVSTQEFKYITHAVAYIKQSHEYAKENGTQFSFSAQIYDNTR